MNEHISTLNDADLVKRFSFAQHTVHIVAKSLDFIDISTAL